MKKGEITAFLSLIFLLLMALIGGVIESASIQVAKNYGRADMNRAMESVFAEYQKELLENYGIFALEASYERGNYDERNMKERLKFYGAEGMDLEIQKIQFLTDCDGEGFFEQVLYYMEHKYGNDLLKEKTSTSELWKKQKKKAEEYEKEEEKSWKNYEELLQGESGEITDENNPLPKIKKLKQMSILELITPKEMQISEKSVKRESLLSNRKKNRGYGDFSENAKDTGVLSTLIFGEYLQEKFSAAADEDNRKNTLDYELEYLCSGKESDRGNLETVAKKILGLRFGVNYVFIQSSAKKQSEAHALALSLCTISAMPGLEGAVEQMILLAWAYGESIVDVRMLLKGRKVATVKSEDSWQLSLSGLLKLEEQGDINDGKDSLKGMSYREYLRILLFLEKRETVSMRALDLIEQNLRNVDQLSWFKADQCISKMQIKSTYKLRRGITYHFQTYYSYH